MSVSTWFTEDMLRSRRNPPFNRAAEVQDFLVGKPCDPDGANHEGSNKWCHYEEPHEHGGFACDSSCPCRTSSDSARGES